LANKTNRAIELYYDYVLPKRFTFVHILAISALSFCLSVKAQERDGWQFDSLRGYASVLKSDAQQVYEVLLKMLDRWNAHDIEGYMKVYSNSPELLVVIDSEQFNGWQQLHDSYVNAYPDRNGRGFIDPKRIKIKLLKPDLALALTWWLVSFPNSKQKVVGNTTMDLQKSDDGWKIIASHTSITGWPVATLPAPAANPRVSPSPATALPASSPRPTPTPLIMNEGTNLYNSDWTQPFKNYRKPAGQ
jgi:ketosteroid isomerase-like protein